MNDIIVKKSKIHGLGVFAAKDFKKGETVIRWDISDKITAKEYHAAKDKKYLSKVGKTYIRMKSPEKYVNHSCNANTCVKKFSDVAKRNITKGKEITGNYIEDGGTAEFNCKCEKCRKK